MTGADHDRVRELKARIREIKKAWPAHTPPPALMMQLDELEEELEKVLARIKPSGGEDHAQADRGG